MTQTTQILAVTGCQENIGDISHLGCKSTRIPPTVWITNENDLMKDKIKCQILFHNRKEGFIFVDNVALWQARPELARFLDALPGSLIFC